MLVLGIDPASTHLALVATNPITRSFVVHKVVLAKRSGPHACANAYAFVAEFCNEIAPMGTPRFAYVEHPVRGRNIKSAIVQAFTGGAVQAALEMCGFQTYLVSPSQWKATVCGNGGADKPQIARVVKAKWPKAAREVGDDYDLSDAAGICLYGVEVSGRGQRLAAAGGLS